MPELPEVETMCRGIRDVVGAKIAAANRVPCLKRPIEITPRIDRFDRMVSGRIIERVERLGKRVVLVLDDFARIVLEPRMTGLVLIGVPPGEEHLRFELVLQTPKVDRLLFWDRRGLGKITYLPERKYQELLESGVVGPDALSISSDEMQARFEVTNQPVKVALLDQKKVAGVGNLYASEILFRCQIHPQTACNRLDSADWQNIHQRMLEVLTTAINYEGSTLADGTYRNAVNDPGSYQNEHQVYDRAGKTCVNCDAEIERIVQAQRATFFCPGCQPQRRLRPRRHK